MERSKEECKSFKKMLKKKGECRLHISIEDPCVKYGDSVRVKMRVSTEKGGIAAKKLEICLMRRIKLNSKQGKLVKRIQQLLFKKERKINVNKSAQEFVENIKIIDDKISHFSYSDGFKQNYGFVDCFEKMLIYTKTKLIECEYVVTVKAFCGKDGPSASLNVFVSNQNKEDYEMHKMLQSELGRLKQTEEKMMMEVEKQKKEDEMEKEIDDPFNSNYLTVKEKIEYKVNDDPFKSDAFIRRQTVEDCKGFDPRESVFGESEIAPCGNENAEVNEGEVFGESIEMESEMKENEEDGGEVELEDDEEMENFDKKCFG